MEVEACKIQYVSWGLPTAACFHYNICCHMLVCLVSKNNLLFLSIQGMSFGGVINICFHMLMCFVSENNKLLISLLGTFVGGLILDVLLLYGIHNVSIFFYTVLPYLAPRLDFGYIKSLIIWSLVGGGSSMGNLLSQLFWVFFLAYSLVYKCEITRPNNWT